MGFLSPPKVPKAPPPANPGITPVTDTTIRDPMTSAASSLISTSAQGLKRRADTQRTSLIGGG